MSVLPPMNIRYPFDPTGKSKTNYVAGEVRTLPPQLQRIIVPAMGAFYANSLIVRHNTNELIRGVDYELAALYHDATIATGKDVNIMIVFINEEIVGDVELYYQAVGGQFTGVWESIQQYVNVLLVDPRKVRWDDVLDKPHFFVPKEHFHDINDIYGLNHIIPKLEEIRQAVLRIRSKEMRRLYDHFLKVKRDTEKVLADVNSRLRRESEKVAGVVDQTNLLKQQVTSIRDRVSALENNTTIQSEIAKLKQKDIALTGSIDTINSNLNGLTTTVSTHTTEIAALKAKDVDYGARITAVENKNTQQDTRLTAIEAKDTNQDSRLAAIEQKNTQQDTKLAEITTKNTQQDNTIAGIVTKNTQQDDRLTALENKNTQQDNRLSALEARNGEQGGSLTALIQKNNDQDARLTAIEQKNVQQDGKISAVETKNGQQDTRLTALENKNTQQDGRMTTIEAKDTAQDGRLTAIENLNNQQNTRLTNIEAKNNEQDTAINNLRNNFMNHVVIDPRANNWLKKGAAGLYAVPKLSTQAGNKITVNSNGELYVAPTQEVRVSPDANNIISLRNNGLYATAPQNAGLDFTALNNLPEKAWAKGTSFLAKGSDGQWHRVVTPEDLVQDIGVNISANTVLQNVGSVFNIKYIVTNSGMAKNTKTTLTIVLPTQSQRTAYTTSNYVETIQGADRFVKTSPTTWDIYGLTKGGTFTLTFNIVPTVFGTYQLGGQVSTTNGVDTNISNNNATLMLTANTTEDPNYVASVDCPLISGVNLADNTPITMVKTFYNRFSNETILDTSYWKQSITKLNATSLANVRLRLNNCSSVICFVSGVSSNRTTDINSDTGVNDDTVYVYNNRSGIARDVMSHVHLDKNEKKMWSVPIHQAYSSSSNTINDRYIYHPSYYSLGANYYFSGIIPFTNLNHDSIIKFINFYANSDIYTFDPNTKILTFANMSTLKTAVIACRPNGNNCKWQLIILSTYEDVIIKNEKFSITGLNNNQYIATNTTSYNFEQKNISHDEYYYGAVPGGRKGIITNINSIEVRIQKGTAANFTINGPIHKLIAVPRQGNVSIVVNSNNIAVSVKSTATSTDDVDMGGVKIKIIG